jgi:hypothetical protein
VEVGGGGKMKPVYLDLVEDLNRLLQDFRSLGEEMASIFLFYLPEQGKKFADTWFRMRAVTRYAEEDIGWYDSLLNGLKHVLRDWINLHTDLTVKFNNGFYHRRQWIFWKDMFTLIRRFEILIERFESRYKRQQQ